MRQAKNAVTEAKENIQVASLQKEISELNDVIDDLDRKIEESNKYYDELIEQAEKYWDSLIKGLEEYRDRWQELADIEEQAKMEVYLKRLGITTEDVLNMSESAFESFKGTYLGMLQEMYSGNDEMIDMLHKFGGVSTDTLRPLAGTLEDTTESLDRFSDSTSTASTNASDISENVTTLNKGTGDLNSTLSEVSDSLDGILGDQKLEALPTLIQEISTAIHEVTDALAELPADIDIDGMAEKFDTLRTAVEKTAASISGGAGPESDGSGSPSGGGSQNAQGESGDGGGADSLVGAIKEFKSETDNALGTDDESGAIGQFKKLEQGVANVTEAIGGEGTEGRGQGSGNEDNTLISSINSLGETATEIIGEPGGDGVIGKFDKLGDTIEEAESHVEGIIDKLNELDGMTAECTITINVATSGGVPAFAAGTAIGDAIGSMGKSGEYHPRYEGSAHVEGTAKVTGDWGVKEAGKSLVGEIGQEIWVHSRNGTFETVGDNGAEFINTEKGDLIFNHLQTKELLSKGNLVGRGKSYANGTFVNPDGKILMPNGEILRPLQPGDREYDLVQKAEAYMKRIANSVDRLVPTSFYEHNRKMAEMVSHITNNSIVNNTRNMQPVVNNINVTCPGVTSQQVAEQLGSVIGKELDRQFSGFHNYTDQMSRVR